MDFEERVRRRNAFDASLVYGTKKFNLATGRKTHMEERERNDNQWTNSETGVIHDHFADHRVCPLCGQDAQNAQVLFVKYGFPHLKCNGCGLVYVDPILNAVEYEKHYRTEHSWEAVLESPDQIQMQTLEGAYSLDIASLYLTDNRPVSICDVGCGPGTLLAEAKRRGYDVFGIEPNSYCHPFLEKYGIPYIGDFFPLKHEVGKQFDCVFLLNVLEHMRDPRETLLETKKIVKPGGLIYISTPNMDAFVNRIMHEKASVFGGHVHLQIFNAKTLEMILRKAGFEPLEYETIITQIGTIKNYLSYQDPYFGDTEEQFSFLTPEMLYKNHMARNINMVGRRIE